MKREGVRLLLSCDAEGCAEKAVVGWSTVFDVSRTTTGLSVEGEVELPEGWLAGAAFESVPTIYCPEHGMVCPVCDGRCFREPVVEATLIDAEVSRHRRRVPCKRCDATGVVPKAAAP